MKTKAAKICLAIGFVFLAAYVGSYLLFVSPEPPSGPNPGIILPNGVFQGSSEKRACDIGYSRFVGKLGINPHIYDPLLSLDRKLRPSRWFVAPRASANGRPNKSPEPTAVGAVRSAVAVHAASRRWLSFLR